MDDETYREIVSVGGELKVALSDGEQPMHFGTRGFGQWWVSPADFRDMRRRAELEADWAVVSTQVEGTDGLHSADCEPEVVDAEIIFDPETGWVNGGFERRPEDDPQIIALWPHPADRPTILGCGRDLMAAFASAVSVPNLAER